MCGSNKPAGNDAAEPAHYSKDGRFWDPVYGGLSENPFREITDAQTRNAPVDH
jgi:hypothetical protein